MRDQAVASLTDIAAVEQRTQAAVAYSRASACLFLWGQLVAAGSMLNQAFPGQPPWSYLLAPAGHDRIAVFWATLMMMPYVIAGLWLGPIFSICGLAGTGLCFGAFFFAGTWLHVWIGATYGACLVLAGLGLKRLGAS